MTQVRERPETTEAPEPRYRGGQVGFGLTLIGLGLLWLLARLDVFEVEMAVVLPVALIAVGLAAIVLSRTGSHAGLVAAGAILALAAIVVGAGPWQAFGDGIGDRLHRPTRAADVMDEYGLGMGQLTIDLDAVTGLGSDPIDVEVGFGEVIMDLPDERAFDITVEVGAGEMSVLGERHDGVGLDETFSVPGTGEPVPLTISVVAGSVEVRR